MITCPHLDGVECSLASRLAKRLCVTTPGACAACAAAATPRQLNLVVLSLAAAALGDDPVARTKLLADHEAVLLADSERKQSDRLAAIKSGLGVGSELWRLLESLGVRHTPTCPCLNFAERMNAWGVAGCRLARAEIVEHMRTHATAYGWATFVHAAGRALLTGLAWRIDLTDPYGSLVDEVVRRAEAASVPSIPVVP